MKRIIGIAGAIALLCANAAAAVHVFGDRELFVSPPDAVAEGFARAVIACRYDQARAFLEDPKAMTHDVLRAKQHAIEERLGQAHTVEAEIVSRDAQRALVDVRLSSAHGSDAFAVSLVFDREWKISEWAPAASSR